MTEPPIDTVIRHLMRAHCQAVHSRLHMPLRHAIFNTLNLAFAEQDRQKARRKK